jgi:tRNA uridine 5-carboxymethylaminomethyl modification enzyme
MHYGKKLGLVGEDFANDAASREIKINSGIEMCRKLKLHARDVNEFLQSAGSSVIESTETISNLCRRPELKLADLLKLNGYKEDEFINSLLDDEKALRQVEIDLKYEGYLKRQQEMVEKLERYEDTIIPLTLNYLNLKALSTEGREKLQRFKPRSIAQASRISGVTPSDISILLVYLKR